MEITTLLIITVIGWIFGAGMLFNKIKNVENKVLVLDAAALDSRIQALERYSRDSSYQQQKQYAQIDHDIKDIISNYVKRDDIESRFDKLEAKIDSNYNTMVALLQKRYLDKDV